jgi:hypothetical protein
VAATVCNDGLCFQWILEVDALLCFLPNHTIRRYQKIAWGSFWVLERQIYVNFAMVCLPTGPTGPFVVGILGFCRHLIQPSLTYWAKLFPRPLAVATFHYCENRGNGLITLVWRLRRSAGDRGAVLQTFLSELLAYRVFLSSTLKELAVWLSVSSNVSKISKLCRLKKKISKLWRCKHTVIWR